MTQSQVTLSDFLSMLKVIVLQYYVFVLANFRDRQLSSDCKNLRMLAAEAYFKRGKQSIYIHL